MLRSLAVVGACVAVVVLFTLRQEPEARSLDPGPVLAAAVETAPFRASVPSGTPEGWRVTSTRVTPPGEDPYAWYVGYVTAEGRFVAVTESDGERAPFLDSVAATGESVGDAQVAGDTWERLADSDDLHRSLVREQDGVVSVVTGTADFEILEDFAAGLS